MKKIFLVLLIVALVGSFAFAEVTGIAAPTVTGDVTTTFGYDLDNEGSGFNNSSSVEVVVPLAGGSDTHAGSGDVYAEITIEDIEINLSTDSDDWDEGAEVSYDADVSAKIIAGAIWVGLGCPDFAINMVDQEDDSDVNLEDFGDEGISIGYASDAFSASVLVSSINNYMDASDDDETTTTEGTSWTDSDDEDNDTAPDPATVANSDHDYVFGAAATVVAGPATVDVAFSMYPDTWMGFGLTAVVAAGPATVTVPFDYISNEVADASGMEANPSVAMAIDGVGSIAADLFYAAYTDIVGLPESEINFGLTFTEGFMDALTMVVEVEATDITEEAGDLGWNLDVDNSYDMGAVAPYLNFGYGSNEVFDVEVGAVFATAIDNATVTVDYTNEALAGDTTESGRITLEVAVVF